ncbi:hypothetical protein ANSO36C_07250 [Nostoc cf. commune SO-36]|uniref:Uncharacterized protein n=1 Tax=Nostoc cf. commune SO-36 TaxID=449208 RepID=A0ABM7YWA1_NOSCO|nr:hypothetical protein [Nostoc commune]BDI14923.1 hypothetical protein ANSO36C_07250 [Nostoc cf. commune SO-36]
MFNDYTSENDLAKGKAEAAKLLAELKVKEAAIKAEEKRRMDALVKKQQSSLRVHEFNNNVIEQGIKKGLLNSSNYPKIYERTVKDFGEDKGRDLFVRTVAGLLTHEYTGVESSTFRIGNGGLTWRGQTYSSPQELYRGVLSLLHGEENNFDPMGGDHWFSEVLNGVLRGSDWYNGEIYDHAAFSRHVQDLVKLTELSKVNPLGEPDASELTPDDMFYINSVLGRAL